MAEARFSITGEVQHVGLRANLIATASESNIMCIVRNSMADPKKVYVTLKSETMDDLIIFYKKIKDEDMRVASKVKTGGRYNVGDLQWINRDERPHDWADYLQMVETEAALKTMAAIKRIEEKINKVTEDIKPKHITIGKRYREPSVHHRQSKS